MNVNYRSEMMKWWKLTYCSINMIWMMRWRSRMIRMNSNTFLLFMNTIHDYTYMRYMRYMRYMIGK